MNLRSSLLYPICTLLFILCINVSMGWCQLASNVDSLQIVLQQENNEHSRMQILNAIGYSLLKENDINGVKYAEEALAIAEKTGNGEGQAYALITLGMADNLNKNYEQGMGKYDKARMYFESVKDSVGLARYYHKNGTAYFRQKKRPEGIQNYLKAISLFELLEYKIPKESPEYKMMELNKITDAATWNGSFDEARWYGHQYLEFAIQQKNKLEEALALCFLANIDYDQELYSSCIEYYTQSFSVYHAIEDELTDDDLLDLAAMHAQMGVAYRHEGKEDTALIHLKQAEQSFIRYQLPGQEIIVVDEIGKSYVVTQQYALALQYFLHELDLAEQIKSKFYFAMAHQNLGSMLFTTQDYENARKHLDIAIELQTQLGNKSDLARLHHKSGMLKDHYGDKSGAIQEFQKMRELAEAIQDTNLLIIAYTNLMLADAEIPNYETAGEIFKRQVAKQEATREDEHTMHVYRFAGICFLKAGNFPEAKNYFYKSLSMAKQLNHHAGMQLAYGNLKKACLALGEYDEAIYNIEKAASMVDSVNTIRNTVALNEIQTRYETEKKEKEILRLESEKMINKLELKVRDESIQRINSEKDQIALQNLNFQHENDLLNKDKKIQMLQLDSVITKASQDSLSLALIHNSVTKQKFLKNLSLVGLGLIMLAGLLGYTNYNTRQKLKMQTLRNKIASDLHDDVGSTLTSISLFSQMAQNESRDVSQLLVTIEESSRKMLDAMGDIVWTIHPENDQLEKIILRMSNFAFDLLGARNIDFEFLADPHLSAIKLSMEARKNLYLIFKEATNNMVKYSGANKARFSLKEEKDTLTMEIQDNGKGFDTAMNNTGNGLKNMKRRAEEIGGKLWIESRKDEGTTVRLSIAV